MIEDTTIELEQSDQLGSGVSGGSLSKMIDMATALSEAVLIDRIANRPVLVEHIRILAKAALLLEEHSIELPPALLQVLHDVGRGRRDPDRFAKAREPTAEPGSQALAP